MTGQSVLRRAGKRLRSAIQLQGSESLRYSLTAGASTTLVLNALSLVLNFGVVLILTRVIGPRGYGAYLYSMAYVSLLVVLAVPGLPQLVVREISTYAAQARYGLARGLLLRSHQVAVMLSIAVSALFATGGYMFVAVGDDLVRRTYFVALLLVPVLGLLRVNEAAMRGFRLVAQGRFGEAVLMPFGTIVLVVIVGVFGALSAATAMAATVAAATAALVVSGLLLRRGTPAPVSRAEPVLDDRVWWRMARPMLVLTAAQTAHFSVGVIVLGAVADVRAAGIYGGALRLAAFVTFAQQVVNYPLAAAIARLHASNDLRRLELAARAACTAVVAVALPVCVLLAVAAAPMLGVLGPDFESADAALRVLLIGELVNASVGSVGIILTMTRHERSVAALTTGAIGIEVALIAGLVPTYGVVGAAIGRTAGIVFLNVGLLVVVRRAVEIAPSVFVPRMWTRREPR